MYTVEVPEYAELAFHYANKGSWFSIDKIFAPFPVDTPTGQYRVGGTLDRKKYYGGQLSLQGYPEQVAVSDSFVEWATNPLGLSFHIEKRDLKAYRQYGKRSEAEFMQSYWQDLAMFVKINREVKGVEFVESDSNYDAAQVYTIGAGSLATSTAWSNKTTSNPISDVAVVKRLNKWLTDMGFNYYTLCYLMEHPVILDAETGDGPHPDMRSPMEEQLSWLSKVFGLQCHVFMAECVADSAAPIADQASTGATDIWGNYVWFGRVDSEVQDNLKIPTWGIEYKYQPEGVGFEGFIANETVDDRAGLHGCIDIDLGYDNQLQTHAKSYGAKIKSVY